MTDFQVIRVMLVDDHAMVRRGLTAFLKVYPDLKMVGEAANGREAVDRCPLYRPDVILMDLMMPEMDGASATRHIRSIRPEIQIIALTSFQEKDMVQEALQAGAISYLSKGVTAQELANAIRAAHAGRSTLAPEATQILIRSANEGPAPGHDLTPREHQVLDLMAEGLSNPKIAYELSVSRSTARAHVSQILSKLGVSNRAEAIALAFRSKLVT
jgi:NarL family two-component system response regulator LiaR